MAQDRRVICPICAAKMGDPCKDYFGRTMHIVHTARAATPGMAKRLGRQVVKRHDWNALQTMERVVAAKFERPILREKLIATGDSKRPTLGVIGTGVSATVSDRIG